jgi:predicted HTH transcriptional regulator
MGKAIRFGNLDGRVDRFGQSERAMRDGQFSEGAETYFESEPVTEPKRRRSSREIDHDRVEAGRKLALLNLLKSGDYTADELGKIFGISRATVYRLIDELRKLQEIAPIVRQLAAEGFFNDGYDWDYDD